MMKKKMKTVRVLDQKVLSIGLLFTTTIVIMLLGLFFIIYSARNNISFPVLNTKVHGSLLGSMVVYLGIRNYLSVKKLRREVYKNDSVFLWSNFKKSKK
jgi:hypothetical protein